MMTAEDLKFSILQLAMSGKLVEQRSEEGTGEVLYKRMQADKARLIREHRIKKDKPLAEVTIEELPFEVPQNWKAVRVGEIGSWSAGATPSRSHPEYYGGDIPWLKTGDLNDGDIYEVPEFITEEGVQHSSVRLNPVGAVLMAMYGATIGKLGILQIEATTNQACCACICYEGMWNKYLFYYLLSQRKNYIAMGAGGAQPNISKDKIVNSIIALPPLAEQKRIVAKIEELMPFVEQYAATSTKLNNLNATFPEMIKKSILQEAVQGKLVPQDPNDEPASVLLKIDQQKKKKNGRRRDVKQKEVGCIYKDEKGEYIELKEGRRISVQNRIPFDIPESWEWIHLGFVCDIARGGSPRPIKSYLTEEPDGINWIKIGDSDIGGKYINSTKEKIIPEGMKKSRYVHSGDFLLTNSMSFGRPYILNCDGCIHDGWLVLTGYKDVYDKDFLYYMLFSGFAFNQFCDVVSGAVVKNLNSDKVADAVFPVPPLAEQKRIVAKIEELVESVNKLVL